MPFRPGDRYEAAMPGRWTEHAACKGLEPKLAARLFFGGPGSGVDLRDARAICAGCDVRAECLAFALETHQEHGIWGGTSERERRALRRSRRRLVRALESA